MGNSSGLELSNKVFRRFPEQLEVLLISDQSQPFRGQNKSPISNHFEMADFGRGLEVLLVGLEII